MSEAEFRAEWWHASTRRIIDMIEAYTAGWEPNGPSVAVARAIMTKIKSMPVPGPTGEPT